MAKFWEVFKRFEEQPDNPEVIAEVQSVVAPTASGLSSAAKGDLANWGLRIGMWVVTKDGTGIVTGVTQDCVEVMLVDDAGHNKKQLNFTAGSVQQAKLGQIPKARRPDVAHSGY